MDQAEKTPYQQGSFGGNAKKSAIQQGSDVKNPPLSRIHSIRYKGTG